MPYAKDLLKQLYHEFSRTTLEWKVFHFAPSIHRPLNRYNIVKQNIDKYGYWTDINRNMISAVENDSVVFAHRRGYINYSDIIYND